MNCPNCQNPVGLTSTSCPKCGSTFIFKVIFMVLMFIAVLFLASGIFHVIYGWQSPFS